MDKRKAFNVAIGLFVLAFVNAAVTLGFKSSMSASLYGAFDASWWVMMVAGVGFFIYARFYAQ